MMNETHANALFINPEPGVHDGCYLITKPRCPIKLAQLNARLMALPDEPEWFKTMTKRMAAIQEVEKQIVVIE
jgi:hypothetical protein